MGSRLYYFDNHQQPRECYTTGRTKSNNHFGHIQLHSCTNTDKQSNADVPDGFLSFYFYIHDVVCSIVKHWKLLSRIARLQSIKIKADNDEDEAEWDFTHQTSSRIMFLLSQTLFLLFNRTPLWLWYDDDHDAAALLLRLPAYVKNLVLFSSLLHPKRNIMLLPCTGEMETRAGGLVWLISFQILRETRFDLNARARRASGRCFLSLSQLGDNHSGLKWKPRHRPQLMTVVNAFCLMRGASAHLTSHVNCPNGRRRSKKLDWSMSCKNPI